MAVTHLAYADRKGAPLLRRTCASSASPTALFMKIEL